MTNMNRLFDRARRLDRWVLGSHVSDERPLRERLLRPRPAVTSAKGRFWYILTLSGMFIDLWFGHESLLATIIFLVLFAGLFVVVALDMSARSRNRDK